MVATFIVYDELDRCPYLPGHVARLPLRVPARPLSAGELDGALEAGDRRQGVFLYRPTCPSCRACEAIRLPVLDFRPSATHRRILRRGDETFRLAVGTPVADEARATLYMRHKWERGLCTADDVDDRPDVDTYAAFLVETCCPSVEFTVWHGERLVAVAVADLGEDALSAVYCCFDPDYSRYSLGTYAILKQWQYCLSRRMSHLYLGLYVERSAHLAYKASFLPHERRIEGVWRRFERDAGTPVGATDAASAAAQEPHTAEGA